MNYSSRISNSKELQRLFLSRISLLYCRILSPANVSDVPAVNSTRPIAPQLQFLLTAAMSRKYTELIFLQLISCIFCLIHKVIIFFSFTQSFKLPTASYVYLFLFNNSSGPIHAVRYTFVKNAVLAVTYKMLNFLTYHC